MCVLLVHHRVRDDMPVVLLANRDEDFDRPFAPPFLWPESGIVAPRDLRAGGTWVGVGRGRAGLVAAITNRRTRAPRTNVRSRGLLVADVLSRRDVDDAAAWLDDHL